MHKYVLLVALVAAFHSAFAQEAATWSTYFESEEVKISVRTSDCYYPEKGINNRYLLFKIENLSPEPVTISYDINRSYNGKQLVPDNNGFEFSIPAQSSVESDCSDLKDGLHLFSKMLNASANSTLSGFELSNMVINGKNVVR